MILPLPKERRRSMRIINPKAELICEKNPYRKVEMAARTCYKSTGNGTEEGARKMCQRLIKSQHTAMLEHAVLCFELLPADPSMPNHLEARDRYMSALAKSPYMHVTVNPIIDLEANTCKTRILASGNLRAISERGVDDPVFRATQEMYPDLVWGRVTTDDYHIYPEVVAKIVNIDELEDLTPFEIGEHKVLTFRFTTDRAVANELVRHRPCSFAQESTRYVNYVEGIKIAEPADFSEKPTEIAAMYEEAWKACEELYGKLIEAGEKPQQARAVLPLGLQTEIVTTANMKEWKHIFNLRVHGTTGAPHPDIKLVMGQAMEIAMQDKLAAQYLAG